MGAVFEARRPGHAPVALKVLLPTADPDLLARFEREAKVLGRLNSPGIVRLLDYGSDRGRAYLVQELCPDGDLAGVLKKRGHLAPEEARALTIQLCEALAAAHAVGVVHRDLKPANVLMVGGQPKLTDFGLARAKGIDRASLTETGVFLGTPAYMAPEQLLDAREVDQRSDVYALGVILYELLSGGLPFGGSSPLAIADAVLHGQPKPLPSSIPADLRAVVFGALSREPQKRYGSAAQLAIALQPTPLSLEVEGSSGGLTPAAIAALVTTSLLLLVTAGLYGIDFASPAETPTQTLAKATPRVSQSPLVIPPTPTPSPSASPPADFSLDEALEALRDPNREGEGMAQIEALARQGEPQASLVFGRLLLGGYGVKRDRNRAGHYLSVAKSHGSWEASLLLGYCYPPLEWEKRRQAPLSDFAKALEAGDPTALRFFVLNQAQFEPALYESFAPHAGSSTVLVELQAFSRVSAQVVDQKATLAQLRRSDSPEARLSRCRIALLDPRPLRLEPDLVELLKQSAAEGFPMAAGVLGEAISRGLVPGTREEARAWLERAALRGRADAAFTRWRLDMKDLRWLKLAAGWGHGPALAPLGDALRTTQPGEAEGWIDAAFRLRADPRAAALLAKLRRSREPTEAMRLARIAASQPDPGSLQLYADLLLDQEAAGRVDRWGALEIFGAEACLGNGAAALRAAKLCQQLQLSPNLVRALLRRALYDEKKVIRDESERQLGELTAGIRETAPVRSQSQLVLLRRAREAAGDLRREAIIEIGRRATFEAPKGRYLEPMIAAAETGDLQSRLSLIRLLGSDSGEFSKAQLEELQEIGESGLYEAWLYTARHPRDKIQLEARLRPLAKKGIPEASYAYGVLLCRNKGTRGVGIEWLHRAKAAGLEKAAEHAVAYQLVSVSAQELHSRLAEARGRVRVTIALSLMARRSQSDRSVGRRALLKELLLGSPPQHSFVLGKQLVKAGERNRGGLFRSPDWSVGILWLRVAMHQRLLVAKVLLGQLYLELRDAAYQAEGFRLVEQVTQTRKLQAATIALAKALLRGDGTRIDYARAERELETVAATSPEARSLLGAVYTARGETRRAFNYLSRELEAGNVYARIPLVELHLAERTQGATRERGLEILRQGADAGEGPSCQLLGDFYQRGQFLRRDESEARRYHKQARRAFAQNR